MSKESIMSKKSNGALVSIEHGRRYCWQQQRRKCGKNCRTCQEKGGHGPYWYKYWREGERVRSKYVGKQLPTDIEFLESKEIKISNASYQAAVIPNSYRSRGKKVMDSREAIGLLPVTMLETLAM